MIYFIINFVHLLTGKIKTSKLKHLYNIRLYGNSKIVIAKNVNLMKGSILKVNNGTLNIGENSKIGIMTRISASNIKIGKNCRINQNSILAGSISLGDNVVLSPFCSIISEKHSFKEKNLSMDENDKKYGPVKGEIVLHNSVYVGAYSLILGNVVIKENSIVDAMTYLKNININSNSIVSIKNELSIKLRT